MSLKDSKWPFAMEMTLHHREQKNWHSQELLFYTNAVIILGYYDIFMVAALSDCILQLLSHNIAVQDMLQKNSIVTLGFKLRSLWPPHNGCLEHVYGVLHQ